MPLYEVKYTYSAKVIPPRGRTARSITVNDRVPIVIRNLPESSFPVAVIFRDWMSAGTAAHDPDELRWDGTDLYRCFDDRDNIGTGSPRTRLREDHFSRMVSGAPGYNPLDHAQRLLDPGSPFEQTDHADLRGRIESDNRDERRAELARRAESIVICDGLVWIKVSEPCWRWSLGNVKAVYGEEREIARDPDHHWRADRLNDSWKGFDEDVPQPDILGSIDVIIPEALRLAPEQQGVLTAVTSVLNTLAKEAGKMSMEAFVIFASLRDSAELSASGDVSDDLSQAIQDTLERWPGGECPAYTDRLRDSFTRFKASRERDAEDGNIRAFGR